MQRRRDHIAALATWLIVIEKKDYVSQYQIRRENGEGEDFADLDEIAARLGGEIDGRFIVCPGPGKKKDDRSLAIIIDHRNPERFYIYDIEGSSYFRAHRHVCALLGIDPNKRKNEQAKKNTPTALSIWEHHCRPAAGTIVEKYLRSRAIPCPCPTVFASARHCATTSGEYGPEW